MKRVSLKTLFIVSGTGEIALLILGVVILALALSACVSLPTVTPTPSETPRAMITLPSPTLHTCTVTGERVYLRAGAGMSYAAIAVTHKGDVLTVKASGEWLKVSTRADTGFIYGKFCQ